MNHSSEREQTFARIEELERRLADQLRQAEEKGERIVREARREAERLVREGENALANAGRPVPARDAEKTFSPPPLAEKEETKVADHALKPLASRLFALLTESNERGAP